MFILAIYAASGVGILACLFAIHPALGIIALILVGLSVFQSIASMWELVQSKKKEEEQRKRIDQKQRERKDDIAS